MTEKISNTSKRISEMMDKLELKQSDIVAKTGITKSALSNYIHGTREPRQDQISKIADPFKINPAWLMGYDVPMLISEIEKTPIPTFSLEHLTLVALYSQLTKEEQELIISTMSKFVASHKL